jgi:hypothetical protein
MENTDYNDFDGQIYLELNPDIKNDSYFLDNPQDHYLTYGLKENRIYKYSQIPINHNLSYYLSWINTKNSNPMHNLPFEGFITKQSIPKCIYMCHKTIDNIKIYSQNWTKLNPDWEIKLYDDEMCKQFLLNEYSQLHYDIFNYLNCGPIKSDFWRICVLYKYGGLYVDSDIEPLVPLKDYIEQNIDFCTCIVNKN